MSYNTSKCRVMLYRLSEAVVQRGRCAEQSLDLTEVLAGACRVKFEVRQVAAPLQVLQVPANGIKKELEDEMEDITVKEEPFLYENKACSPEVASPAHINQQAPSLASCKPCKMEDLDNHEAHQILTVSSAEAGNLVKNIFKTW
ncbi:uncharacterized protein LOC108669486 isoform X3 [Hyalella azteca]|uniref:Uncharacterized protein LOC108669486 isoform X3 n=1 Tax=Hyalella azteca TaxID=294128 RepID=A0A979FTF9_HYAAZ|nr:uncharacterized protein LOC108669486 isoform X3 [Hyalella azteca]